MAHAYSKNLVHVVFSTKDRRPQILASDQAKLHAYFVGIGRNHGFPVVAAGGTENHVHLLFGLPPSVTLSKAIQTFKANSSRWMGEKGVPFSWQKGYGAFSVSPSQVETVKTYIRNQPEHHKRGSFEQEFLALLKKSGIEYDPKFVFG